MRATALAIYADLAGKIETIECLLPHTHSYDEHEKLEYDLSRLNNLMHSLVLEYLPDYYELDYPVAA